MKKLERRALSIDEINSLALKDIDMSKFHAIHKEVTKKASNKKS